MRRLIRSVVLTAALLLSMPVGAASATARTGDDVAALAVVRALPLGSVVRVAGIVSTPSGAFESSFFDKGFGLQDRSAGIYVSTAFDAGARVGDEARVTGVLQDSFGLLILVPTSLTGVVVHRDDGAVRPRPVRTGGVGEATEGRIVRVVGRVTDAVSADLPFGYKFVVDDGSGPLQVFVNLQTGIDPGVVTSGSRVSVTGFSSQFDTHYEIDPRFPRDVVVLRH
jgi:hypothetical protein